MEALTTRRHDALVAVALLAALLALKASTIHEPNYWDGLLILTSSAYEMLDTGNLLPWNFGHPPLQPMSLALVWKVTGTGAISAHAWLFAHGWLALFASYKLTEHWFGRRAAWLAIVMLLTNQLFFAQAGLVTDGVPLAAMTVSMVYAVATRRLLLFTLTAAALLFSKETTAPSVGVAALALVLGRFGERRAFTRSDAWLAAAVVLPFVPLLAWWFFLVRTHGRAIHTELLFRGEGEMATRVPLSYLRHLVFDATEVQTNRTSFFFTFPIVVRWIVRRKIDGPTALLFGIVLVYLTLFAFTVDIPRYHTAYVPLFAVAGAGAADDLLRRGIAHRIGFALVYVAINVAGYDSHRGRVHGWMLESNMEYRDLVATQLQAARYIEEQRPGAKVVTTWPMAPQLTEPRHGYVKKPIALIDAKTARTGTGTDPIVVYWSDQVASGFMRPLSAGLHGAVTFENGGKQAVVADYERLVPP